MNMLRVNFPELYQRHLCRHSQYGINVVHLATVIGSYLALFWIAAWVIDVPWILLAIPLPYFVVLGVNVSARVLAACVVFVAGFFVLFFSIPAPPVWLCPVVLVVCHLVQNWSHRLWDLDQDMSAYQEKYKKGPALSFPLAFYELPLLLNYLVFDRKSGVATVEPAPTSSGAPQAP
ncbi:hypothetical protein AYO44_03405 [Planctomycetaceae bacterium SCGC AG-212-F19]|nr:hypothetical protein AYO44_03405 [Planctomycetaceae bacterium SCGC AG-212-F19]